MKASCHSKTKTQNVQISGQKSYGTNRQEMIFRFWLHGLTIIILFYRAMLHIVRYCYGNSNVRL